MSRQGYIPASTSEARSSIDLCIASVFSVIERHRLDLDGTLHESLERLKARAASNEICLAVLGEFSSGKTTFINTLLDTDLLETGLLPTTAVCTYIRYSSNVSCELVLRDGAILQVTPSDLRADATVDVEEGLLDHVTLRLPASLLSLGLTVVDTPGVNVNIDAHEAITRHAIQEANACVYLMDARQPGKKTTIEFLRRIQGQINKTFFVLNRADILDTAEQQEALEFVTSALREECGISQPRIMLLSSKTRLSEASELWSARFEEFQQMLQDFMRSERDTVIYAELARLLAETIELSEGLLSSKYRLAESELSAHYEVALPDASEVLHALREQSTVAVIDDSTNVKAQFYKLHDNVCRSLRDKVERKLFTTKTTAGLVKVGSTEIGRAFEEHANHLQMFLNSSFESIYTRRQAQVRTSIAGVFSGVQWVDHKALFSRPSPWICILTGAALATGVEFLVGAPFVDRVMAPLLGATAAAVGYGIYHWARNRSSFSPPKLPATMHSGSASAAVASGATYQNAEANPIKANMAPVQLGKVVWAASGNPLFAVVGASVSAGILGFQLLSDKLSGRLDKMRNEMREALRPVFDDFERKTRENGTAAIAAGESAVLESLSSVLDLSMERYQVVLDRLLRPHRHIQERLEQRRNEILSDAQNLRKLQEEVLASRSLLVAEMKGISPTYSDRILDPLASEADSSSMFRCNKVGYRVQLRDVGEVAETFRGDHSLILSWLGCLIAGIILAVVSLSYAGAFTAPRVSPVALVPGTGADAQKPSASSGIPQATSAVTDDYTAIRTSLLVEGYLADGPMSDIQGIATGVPLHAQKASCSGTMQPCEKLFVFAGPRAVWSEDIASSAALSDLTATGPGQFSALVKSQLGDSTETSETVSYKWDGSRLSRTHDTAIASSATPAETVNEDQIANGAAVFPASPNAHTESLPTADSENQQGIAFANDQQYDLAIAAFSRGIQLNSPRADLYNNRGAMFANKGDARGAISDYDQALRLNSNYPEALGNRGNAYLQLGDYAHAIADYDRAIQLNPSLTFAVTNRRIALLKQTQQSQVGPSYPLRSPPASSSVNSYSAPIVRKPPSAYEPRSVKVVSYDDTLQSARTAFKRKDLRGAYQLATQARDLEPNSLPALELLQVILAEAGDPVRAESAALEAIKHGGKAVFELQHFHAWPTDLHAARLVITSGSLEFIPEAPCKYADFTIPLASIKSVDMGVNMFNAYLLNIKFDDSRERKGKESKGQISFSDSSSTLNTLGSVYRISSRRSMPEEAALFSAIRDTILNAKGQP